MGGNGVQVRFRAGDIPRAEAARALALDLNRAGYETFFAGGCVRDALLGRPVQDIDLATAATPDQVEALFPGETVAVGKAFGVVVARRNGFSFDVATFRTDGPYRDGRHPEQIAFTNAEGDALRRDFTVNGLFCDPATGDVTDYVGGLTDLQAQVIRAIGDPAARFREDRLRMLRAVRFAAVLEFTVEPRTREALEVWAPRITEVSPERVAHELNRILCEAPLPSTALNLMRETGLLSPILPEVARLYGTAQPPRFHPEGDVWTHTCLMLDALPPPRDLTLAWAVLLHDLGKPMTCREETDPATGAVRIRFPCHAPVGAAMAEELLTRLRQPSARIAEVRALVAGHMRGVESGKMRRATLRRFMGEPTFPRMLELMRLDIQHSNGDLTPWRQLVEAYAAFVSEPVLPEPLVRGRDLIAWGVPSGPQVGKLLRELYDAQLEGQLATLEQAREMVCRRRAAPR
ncbi:MAG TPA: CCA tRNA nucleotidyltransferase [Kiritimatiellia bacterium]|jgi:poly(A) polymerase|nr:CCA tRNA nucleotidyltransferase [Kiritimatiellia bacterium]HPC49047.1 CCA tRNA nucleotidyltransferase [Kiritimatiellia bacterium]HPK37579.1 CCA tRNA nucleotidyltransferase [Kiritimatiellia bacterium]HPW75029.1 CCA tRNA nucleotidyltransferase [Kiritimatiellia bacterium]